MKSKFVALLFISVLFQSSFATINTAGELAEKLESFRAVTLPNPSMADLSNSTAYMSYVLDVWGDLIAAEQLCDIDNEVTGQKLFSAVGSYLEGHTSRQEEAALVLVREALRLNYGCNMAV